MKSASVDALRRGIAIGLGLIGAFMAVELGIGRILDARHAPQRWTLITLPTRRLRHALPELHHLQPAQSQQPLPDILARVGENITTFFRKFPNVASDETVHEEVFSLFGGLSEGYTQKFRYLAEVKPGRSPWPLKEYRTDRAGHLIGIRGHERGFMLTKGFVSLPFIFATGEQRESRFRYLGTEKVGAYETDAVAFAQRSVARDTVIWTINGHSFNIRLQGVAWIDPTTAEIIKLRTDLLQINLKASLRRLTTVISFSPKQFATLSRPLWLPRTVVVTASTDQLTYLNMHTYKNQHLFLVRTNLQFGAQATKP